MNRKLWNIIFLIAVLTSCEKDEVTIREYPRLLTMDVTDITSEGAVFGIEFLSPGNTPIIDHGFVWSKYKSPRIENSEIISLGTSITDHISSKHVEYALNEDQTYYVRAYAKNDEYITYGNEVSFKSLGSKAPVIFDFEPKAGLLTDTIKIYGKYFSNQKINLKVLFNEHYGNILTCNDSLIVVKITSLTEIENQVKISLFGNISIADETFKLLTPELTSFSPTSAKMGDTVTLSGKNFINASLNQQIYFGEKKAELLFFSENQIKVKVPEISINLPDPEHPGNEPFEEEIRIKLFDFESEYSEKFQFLLPVVLGFQPQNAQVGDTVSLIGKNLLPLDYRQDLFIELSKAEQISISDTEIKFIVPWISSSKIEQLPVDGNFYSEAIIEMSNSMISTGVNLGYLIPTIHKISPSEGFKGDTIAVHGKNFIPLSDNHHFQVGDLAIEGIYVSDSIVKIVVPDYELTFTDPHLPHSQLSKKDIRINFSQTLIHYEDLLTVKYPSITDIQPRKVTPGDTIQITGTDFNFSINDLNIKLNQEDVQIIKFNSELIEFLMPIGKAQKFQYLEIDASNISYEFNGIITLSNPNIARIDPMSVSPGDTVKAIGSNFYLNVDNTRLYFQNIEVEPISISSDTIVFQIPGYTELDGNHTSVKYVTGELQSNNYQALHLKKPRITSLSTNKIINHEDLIITGENLSPYAWYPRVRYSEFIISTLSHTNDKIVIDMRDNNYDQLVNYVRKEPISYSVNGYQIYSEDSVEYIPNSLWLQSYDFPGAIRTDGKGFSAAGRGYIVSGGQDMKYHYENHNDLWEFNPDTHQWTKKNDPPFLKRFNPIVVQDGETIIVGMGQDRDFSVLKDIWTYHAANDSWTKLTDFPSTPRSSPIYFLINNKLYIGGGSVDINDTAEFWEYDIAGNKWTKKSPIGFWENSNYYVSCGSYSFGGKGYSFYRSYLELNSNAYGVVEYNPESDSWSKSIDWNGTFAEDATTFIISDNIYLFDQYNALKLNIPNMEISSVYMKQNRIEGAIGFSLNDKGYYCLGSTTKEIWRFNPDLLE